MENSTYKKALVDNTKMYEKKIIELNKKLDDEHACFEGAEDQLDPAKKLLSDYLSSMQVTLLVTQNCIGISFFKLDPLS